MTRLPGLYKTVYKLMTETETGQVTPTPRKTILQGQGGPLAQRVSLCSQEIAE